MKKDKELKQLHKLYDRLCQIMSKEKADYFLKAHMIDAVENGKIDLDTARKLADELQIDFIL